MTTKVATRMVGVKSQPCTQCRPRANWAQCEKGENWGMSEPHTGDENGDFLSLYYYVMVRTSVGPSTFQV